MFEENILKQAQKKINERLQHKNLSVVLESRIGNDLRNFLHFGVKAIEEHEIFQLKLQLFNSQLGLGNNELRKLAKNSDQVQQMKNILSA